jgi:hypothetical protein
MGALEAVPFMARSFVKGFREYDDAVAPIRKFIQPRARQTVLSSTNHASQFQRTVLARFGLKPLI